jgi:hypothetical protein
MGGYDAARPLLHLLDALNAFKIQYLVERSEIIILKK